MKIYLVKLNQDSDFGVIVIADSVEDAVTLVKEDRYILTSNFGVSDIGIAHDDQKRGIVLNSWGI